MKPAQEAAIRKHGLQLLAIFPNATLTSPVDLCRALRRLEAKASAIGLRLCNGPEYPNEDDADKACAAILGKVNRLLGNVRAAYQPKTGARCSCKRGQERDNCPTCEGTGYVIDFAAIRARRAASREIVPVFINRDPRGYALKIDDEWMRAHPDARLETDWGGYGLIAPEIK